MSSAPVHGLAVAVLAMGVTLAVLAAGGATAGAQTIDVTVQPFMTKGPATAQVTIVEFADYQ